MRREQFSLEMSNVDWVDDGSEPSLPTVTVAFEGEKPRLRRQLTDAEGTLFGERDTDVTFRLHGALTDPEASGVLAVTDRVTGDYILEFNVGAEEVLRFTKAARRYGERTDDSVRYRIRIGTEGDVLVAYEKRTLLVYSEEGELLRQHSLIPSGVEI